MSLIFSSFEEERFVLDNTENSEEAASQTLEVAGVEETLPEESPQVDHSNLYVWVADSKGCLSPWFCLHGADVVIMFAWDVFCRFCFASFLRPV